MNELLRKYLSYGFINQKYGVLSMFLSNFVAKENAITVFKTIEKKQTEFIANHQIAIKTYHGKNQTTNEIQKLLINANNNAIITALVHGSIATDEAILYSDFDGILIIDPNKINTIEELIQLRKLIAITERLMLKTDALQHHGWMTLFSNELDDFPDTKIPAILFNHSRSIYPVHDFDLKIKIQKDKQDYQTNFKILSKSIEHKLKTKSYSNNFYTFKNIISEILLLPAVFMQAMLNKPVLKSDSFRMTQEIISETYYSIIHEIEVLRSGWSQEEANSTKEARASRFKYIKPLQNIFRTPLPKRYQHYFDPEKTKLLTALIEHMKLKITKSNNQPVQKSGIEN